MSLTKSNIPLDSDDIPSVFSTILRSNYVGAAFIMMVLYDHVITMDKEVEWIWTLRWRMPKIIFLFNRYLITSIILLGTVSQLTYSHTLSYCEFAGGLVAWLPVMTFSGAELLMIVQVSSLYGHRKLVIWFLGICFILAVTISTVIQVRFMHAYFGYLRHEYLPGCFIDYNEPFILWHAWVPALSIEGILMLLAGYKIFSYRKNMNRTITVLARDSTICFVVLFVGLVLTIADAIHDFLPVPPLFPTMCITSITVGRMMMNLRALILADPKYTVHLAQPPEFFRRHNLGAEVEEEA